MSNEVFIIMVVVIALVSYKVFNRSKPYYSAKIAYLSRDLREGRIFKAEDSLSENRVTLLDPKGPRKVDRMDFNRLHGPLKLYEGQMRIDLFGGIEGGTDTFDWSLIGGPLPSVSPLLITNALCKSMNNLEPAKLYPVVEQAFKDAQQTTAAANEKAGEHQDMKPPQTAFEMTSKFRSLIRALDIELTGGLRKNWMWVVMGLSLGALLMKLLDLLVPGMR